MATAARAARSRQVAAFTRITTSGRVIPEFEGLRTSLIFVILVHLDFVYSSLKPSQVVTMPGFSAGLFRLAYHAFLLFFSISGFIIALPFAEHRLAGGPAVSLRAYFLRRFTRIEPPYVFNLLVIFAYATLVAGAPAGELMPHLLASLFYLHGAVYGTSSTINVVAWSLEVEVQFYLLAPILAALFFGIRSWKWRRGALAATMLAFAAVQWLLPEETGFIANSLVRFLPHFLAGFLLADLYALRESATCEWKWDVIGALVLIAMYTSAQARPLSVFLFPFLVAGFYWAVLRGRALNRCFTWTPLTLLGGMCYSTYLWHAQIISFFAPRTAGVRAGSAYLPNLAIQCGLLGPLILIFCGAAYVFVERPCMRRDWPQRWWRRLRG